MHHPVSIIRSLASNQIILKSALYAEKSLFFIAEENKIALRFWKC